MSDYITPEHARSALVTVDVQRDTLDGAPLEIQGTSACLPNMRRLVESFRSRSRPVVHVVRLYEADGSNVDLCRRQAVERGEQTLLVGSPRFGTCRTASSNATCKLGAAIAVVGSVPTHWSLRMAHV
jgi:nicotinamidase-related amidase